MLHISTATAWKINITSPFRNLTLISVTKVTDLRIFMSPWWFSLNGWTHFGLYPFSLTLEVTGRGNVADQLWSESKQWSSWQKRLWALKTNAKVMSGKSCISFFSSPDVFGTLGKGRSGPFYGPFSSGWVTSGPVIDGSVTPRAVTASCQH